MLARIIFSVMSRLHSLANVHYSAAEHSVAFNIIVTFAPTPTTIELIFQSDIDAFYCTAFAVVNILVFEGVLLCGSLTVSLPQLCVLW